MTPEKRVENAIKKRLTAMGYYFNKTFSGAHENKGIPDLIGVGRGLFFAIEVKRLTGGAPTKVQMQHLRDIANNGGLAFVANDPQVCDFIAAHYRHPQPDTPERHGVIVPLQDDDVTIEFATQAWRSLPKTCHVLQILPNEKPAS